MCRWGVGQGPAQAVWGKQPHLNDFEPQDVILAPNGFCVAPSTGRSCSLSLPSQQEQEVESALRRKFTLTDKSDNTAISTVQKVSTLVPTTCPPPRVCTATPASCIKQWGLHTQRQQQASCVVQGQAPLEMKVIFGKQRPIPGVSWHQTLRFLMTGWVQKA